MTDSNADASSPSSSSAASNATDAAPASEQQIARLNSVRNGLLVLHKSLLDAERLRYERENGRMESGNELLQKLAFDPAFAWLRLYSSLIVQIDERVEDKKSPISTAEVDRLMGEARGIVVGREGGDDYQRNYTAALQEHPDVVIAQSKVSRLLI